MLVFCLFWLPAMSFFWNARRAPFGGFFAERFAETLCALTVGAAAGIGRFLFVSFWTADGFGLSRFISACLDYITLPVFLPIAACFIFARARKAAGRSTEKPDWTSFTLISLIPPLLICAIRWGTEKNPANLVLIPLLWSAIAVNLTPLLLFIEKKPSLPRHIIGAAGIFVAAFLGAAVWWAFFASFTVLGAVLLALELVPALLTSYRRFRGRLS
jgi:hypothetical protein